MLEEPSYVSAFHHGNLFALIAKSAKGDVRSVKKGSLFRGAFLVKNIDSVV